MYGCINNARADTVHANALAADFQRQTTGEGIYGTFGGGIVCIFVRGAQDCSDGRNVHNGSALAAIYGGHPFNRLSAANKTTRHVGHEQLIDAISIHAKQAALLEQNASVVHQRSQGAELLIYSLEQPQSICLK